MNRKLKNIAGKNKDLNKWRDTMFMDQKTQSLGVSSFQIYHYT